MGEYLELAIAGEPLQGLRLEEEILGVIDVVEERSLEREEPAADEAIGLRGLLVELRGNPVVDAHLAVAGRRPDPRHGADASTSAVVLEQRGDVDRPQPVAVGEQEGVGVDVVAHPRQPSPRPRQQARLGQRDLPVLAILLSLIGDAATRPQGDRQVRRLLAVVEEELLDQPALVAQAHDEPAEPVMPVQLHDVPQHRPFTDLHQGLGQPLGLLAQPRPHPPGEDDHRDLLRLQLFPSHGAPLLA